MSDSSIVRRLDREEDRNLEFQIQLEDAKRDLASERLGTNDLITACADLRAQLIQRMRQNNENTSGVIDTVNLPRVEELQGMAEDRYDNGNQQLEKQVEELLTYLGNLPVEQRASFNGIGDRLSNSVARDRQNVRLLRAHWETRAGVHLQRAVNAQRELDVLALNAYQLASDGEYSLGDVRRMCATVYAQVDTTRARLADAAGRIAPPAVNPEYIIPEKRVYQPFDNLIREVNGEVDRLVELVGIAEAAKSNPAAPTGPEASDAAIARLQKEVTAERLRATSLAAQLQSARTGPLSQQDCDRGDRQNHANLVMAESEGRVDWISITSALGLESRVDRHTAVAAIRKLQDVSQANQNNGAGTQENPQTGNTSPEGRRPSEENASEAPQRMDVDNEDEVDVELMLDQVVALIGAEIPNSSSNTVEELVQEFIDEFTELRAHGQRMADIQRSLEKIANALIVDNSVILSYYARDVNAIRTSFGEVERNYQLMVNQSQGSSVELSQPVQNQAALNRATQVVDTQIYDSLAWITTREEQRRERIAELERIRTQMSQFPPSANNINRGSLENQPNAPQNLLTEAQRALSLANNAQLAADALRVESQAERDAAAAIQRQDERRRRQASAERLASHNAGDDNNTNFEDPVNTNNVPVRNNSNNSNIPEGDVEHPVNNNPPVPPKDDTADDGDGHRTAPANDTNTHDGDGGPPAKDARSRARKGKAPSASDAGMTIPPTIPATTTTANPENSYAEA